MTTRIALTGEFQEDGGIGFRTALPPEALQLLASELQRRVAFVTEDDTVLPSRDVLHEEIRRTPGCFSIWGDEVYWSASDGSDPRTNGRRYSVVVPDPESIVPAGGTYLLPRPFSSAGGVGVRSAIPDQAWLLMHRDSLVQGCSTVLEDGVPLPLPDSQHQDICEFGGGRFSIWGDEVIFSASDSSDCATNGRRYELHVPEPGILQGTLAAFERRVAADDEFVLRLLAASADTNNTITNNFLACEAPLAYFAEHGVTGGRAVIMGCGAKPWAPLRFLAAGFDEVVGNDLLPVAADFPSDAVGHLLELLDRATPALARRLEARVLKRGVRCSFAGLISAGHTPFEHLDLASNSVDAIFSVSVLEHVMQPAAVYETMARLLRPGGIAFHVIDLRDHLAFSDPLRFLRMSEKDYKAINTENRLRASDHIRLAKEVGLDVAIDHMVALAESPRPEAGSAKCASVVVDAFEAVTPVVGPEELACLDARFRAYDARDLSIIGITMALHRLAGNRTNAVS